MQKQLCSTLILALTLLCLPLRAAPPQHDTSQAEKAKKCEETFIMNLLNVVEA